MGIHKEYIAAGVNAIKTNTFSANGKVFEDENELREIVTQGYRLANQAVTGTEVEVFADIGNISGEGDLTEKYRQTAELFITLGATRFLFETLTSFDEIIPAAQLIKAKVADAVIMASFAVSRDGYTTNGLHYRPLVEKAVLNEAIDIVGLNCLCGPTHILSLVNDIKPLPKPLAAMPNAGYPVSVNGRLVYNDNPNYFAQKLLEIKQAGAAIIGGCCGTTPRHIACAAALITRSGGVSPAPSAAPAPKRFTFSITQDRLKRKPISVELDPPSDCDTRFITEAAQKLKSCGVTVITLADSPLAKTRADSFLTAAMIKREVDIDVLPHLTCRDKNHIAIKGSLLGASFSGINRVLVVTGDPVASAESFRNPNVFSFNSKELIKYIKSLNEEVFADRAFSIGGGFNVNALHFEAELNRCVEKVGNGADFLYSQPLFSDQAVNHFAKARRKLDCALYAGILPFVSYKNAVFLNNEVVGISIPTDTLDSLKNKNQGETRDMSLQFCRNMMERVYDDTDGFYIMVPMKKVDWVCELIQRNFDD